MVEADCAGGEGNVGAVASGTDGDRLRLLGDATIEGGSARANSFLSICNE